MQNLLGLCVDNTNEMSTTIEVSFNVQDIMKNIQDKIKEENMRAESNDTDQLIAELSEHWNGMKANVRKLEDLRTKTIIWRSDYLESFCEVNLYILIHLIFIYF